MINRDGLEAKLTDTTRRLIFDLGANINPILPTQDPSTAVVAFEPVVHALLPKQDRLVVVGAAVTPTILANSNTTAEVFLYGANHQSASLHRSRRKLSTRGTRRVPLVSARALIESVPKNVSVWLWKSDVQGLGETSMIGSNRQHYR